MTVRPPSLPACSDPTALLAERSRCLDPARRAELRDTVVLQSRPFADRLAARYEGRGIPIEDLRQVAYLALCKAVDRFDAGAGHDFWVFCLPTVTGELRRHFRDEGWMVRPPRRIQELQPRVSRASEALFQELGRAPTTAEVAVLLHVSEPEVAEASARDGAFHPTSLDLPVGERGETTLAALIPAEGSATARAEARLVLAPLVRRLSERDRRVLGMRYYQEWTQGRIADELGVSQVQVSRILARILADLRLGLDAA